MRIPSALGVTLAGVTFATAFTLREPAAGAQQQTPPSEGPKRPYKPQPLILQRQQLGSAGLPDAARARMRSGDCDGALEVFDAALRTLKDPALNRDRGLCHEKLGHIYPAIDDYRVYLTERPEAADAPGISQRLRRLEDQASGRTSTASTDDDDTPPEMRASADVKAGVTADVKADVNGSKASADAKSSNATTDNPTAADKLDYAESEEDVLHTALRAGRGWAVAPFFAEHKWFISGTSLGDSETWSESVGIQVRYATGAIGALVLEAGYEHFNSTSIDAATVSGLTSQVAYEFRFPFDPDYDNQIFFAPGLGFEHLVYTSNTASSTSESVGGFVLRGRVGWRHMLQPATALDVALDAGAANFFQYSKFPFDSSASSTGLVAAEVAVLWGL